MIRPISNPERACPRPECMKTDTKTRILKAGAGIVLQKGFFNTGLAEVLEKAKVPKGSFYFYFNNKEDFGLQRIDLFAGYLETNAQGFYQNEELSPLEKIRHLFRWQADSFHGFYPQLLGRTADADEGLKKYDPL
jgi:AcrR family transcriptional regulator